MTSITDDIILDDLPIDPADDETYLEMIREEINQEIEKMQEEEEENENVNTKDKLHYRILRDYPEIPRSLRGYTDDDEEGVDVDRYSHITSDNHEIVLSYAIMKYRNLNDQMDMIQKIKNQWLIKNDASEQWNQLIREKVLELGKKMELQQWKELRQHQAVEFSDMNEYLENKWKELISDLINIGIEIS